MPITTTAMIGAVVGYLAKKMKDNQSIHDFFTDFTEASVKWVRPIFLTDDAKPKEILTDLQEAPSDKLNTDAVENALAKILKKDPAMEKSLREMYETILKKAPEMVKTNTVNVTGNDNKVYTDINNSTITDNSVKGNQTTYKTDRSHGKIVIRDIRSGRDTNIDI